MSYTRLTWVESETPLSAQNMNNIEDGIEELQAQKVDKTSGKGLSTNDYTTAEKTKLAGIAAGAEVNVQSDWSQSDSSADDFIKNKPAEATTSAAGLMSAADKTKLNGIEAGAEVNKSISSLVLTTNSNVTFEAGNFFQIAFVSEVTSNRPAVTGIREMKFINSSNGASKLLTGGYTLAVGAVTGGWKTSLTIALWNPMNGDVTLNASKSSITLAIYGD